MSNALNNGVRVRPLNFNIPVDLSSNVNTENVKWKWLGYLSDSYFCLSSKKAYLIQTPNLPFNATLVFNSQTSDLLNAVKVITWLTGIIPLIMLVAKLVFRQKNHFSELDKGTGFILDKILPAINNASQEQIIHEDSNYFGAYSDGTEYWHICIDSREDTNVILKLYSTMSGKTIVLDLEVSMGLYEPIKNRRNQFISPLA